MLSLADALSCVLGEADPGEAIQVPLTEALGLVLAETLYADVDMPPFDRAAIDGYAARSVDATLGAHLLVMRRRRNGRPGETIVEAGETAHVSTGDPMPLGADAVIRTEDTRPDPGVGPPRVIEVLRTSSPGLGVVPRGYFLNAGTPIAESGAKLRLPMVSLLAAQGSIHPVCHRRVRVAALAVGDHLVGPAEAPVMHRERNAASLTAIAPALLRGATAHDLGTISERDLPSALQRALTAPIVILLGESTGAIPRGLEKAGVETLFSGVSLHPGKRLTYGVLRGDSGRAVHHIFHMAPGPVGVLAAMTLLVSPLIDRLHGGPPVPPPPSLALWTGPPHRATDDRLWAVPVTLAVDPSARLTASPCPHRGKDDLFGFSRAEALALLPPRSGPLLAGELVPIIPLGA